MDKDVYIEADKATAEEVAPLAKGTNNDHLSPQVLGATRA